MACLCPSGQHPLCTRLGPPAARLGCGVGQPSHTRTTLAWALAASGNLCGPPPRPQTQPAAERVPQAPRPLLAAPHQAPSRTTDAHGAARPPNRLRGVSEGHREGLRETGTAEHDFPPIKREAKCLQVSTQPGGGHW